MQATESTELFCTSQWLRAQETGAHWLCQEQGHCKAEDTFTWRLPCPVRMQMSWFPAVLLINRVCSSCPAHSWLGSSDISYQRAGISPTGIPRGVRKVFHASPVSNSLPGSGGRNKQATRPNQQGGWYTCLPGAEKSEKPMVFVVKSSQIETLGEI